MFVTCYQDHVNPYLLDRSSMEERLIEKYIPIQLIILKKISIFLNAWSDI